MPNTATLSNGMPVEIPDDAQAADVPRLVQEAEAQLAEHYGQQAGAQNSPVTAGSKIYSASNVYPNTYFGAASAWADHNLGGNWMNRNIAQPVENALGGPGNSVPEAALRTSSNVLGGALDLPATTYNVGKHFVRPDLGQSYDAPTISGTIQHEAGAEMPANAPWWQKYAETAAGSLSLAGLEKAAVRGASFLPTAARNLIYGQTGALSGDLASKMFQGTRFAEPAALLANVIGGGGVPAKQIGGKWVGGSFQDPSAEASVQAAENIKPTTPGGNFQGFSGPPPAGTPDFSNYRPSFTTLADPTGQRIANTVGSIPIAGNPIEQANQQTKQFIKSARDASAESLAAPGGGLPPNVGPDTMGSTLTRAAQDAVNAIQSREKAAQENVAQQMNDVPVPIPNTISVGRNAVANNARGEPQTNATNARVDELVNAAPGGSKYAGPPVPLPALPTSQWSALSDWVTNLNDTLAQSGRPSLPKDIATQLKDAANAERETAANSVSPGLGIQFRNNNENYARALEQINKLLPVSGEPLGQSGRFTDVPGEGKAALAMTGKLHSPSDLEIFNHPDFSPEARQNAIAQYISTIGDTGQGDFRPEYFASDYLKARPGIDTLAVGGPGGATPSAATNVLDNAAQLGAHWMPQTSRIGLTKTLGSGAAIAKLLETGGWAAKTASGIPLARDIVTPLIAHGMARGLESDAVYRRMANQPQDWPSFYRRLPNLGMSVDTGANDWRRRAGIQ